jgi:hypothetical protein
MPRWFKALAEECGALFLDSGQYIESSKLDGVHFEAPEHRKLAQVLADFIRGERETAFAVMNSPEAR